MLTERIEERGSSRLNLEFLEEKRNLQNEIMQIKLDYNDQIDKLKFEILESKKREFEAQRDAEYENQRHLNLQKELDSLRTAKQVENFFFYIILINI